MTAMYPTCLCPSLCFPCSGGLGASVSMGNVREGGGGSAPCTEGEDVNKDGLRWSLYVVLVQSSPKASEALGPSSSGLDHLGPGDVKSN